MTHFSTKGSTHTVYGAAWGKGQGRSGTAAECPVEAARARMKGAMCYVLRRQSWGLRRVITQRTQLNPSTNPKYGKT